jgi:thiamine biosynthesis protein ThiC
MSNLFENMICRLGDEDFTTVLSAVVREALRRNYDRNRLMTLVSDGGALPSEWFEPNEQEKKLFLRNPIAAIKDLRTRIGCPLKDAKDKLVATRPNGGIT